MPATLATRALGQPAIKRPGVKQNSGRTVAEYGGGKMPLLGAGVGVFRRMATFAPIPALTDHPLDHPPGQGRPFRVFDKSGGVTSDLPIRGSPTRCWWQVRNLSVLSSRNEVRLAHWAGLVPWKYRFADCKRSVDEIAFWYLKQSG